MRFFGWALDVRNVHSSKWIFFYDLYVYPFGMKKSFEDGHLIEIRLSEFSNEISLDRSGFYAMLILFK